MGNARETWYVSHVTGNDSNTCNSQFSPCKTLRHTVDLAGDGDSIYLDGRGTEKHPYGCEKPTSLPSKLSINKSLAIVGFYQRAYLSCYRKLVFRTPGSTKILNVSIDNLSFVGTGLYFKGNYAVSIVNSTFSNCDSALKIIPGANTMLSVRMSVFTNNMHCLELSNFERQTANVVLEMSDVSFKKNRIKHVLIDVFNPSGLTSVRVSNCLFEENYSKDNTSSLIVINTDPRHMGELRVVNSSFISNYIFGITVLGYLNMSFHNLTFTSIKLALYIKLYRKVPKLTAPRK